MSLPEWSDTDSDNFVADSKWFSGSDTSDSSDEDQPGQRDVRRYTDELVTLHNNISDKVDMDDISAVKSLIEQKESDFVREALDDNTLIPRSVDMYMLLSVYGFGIRYPAVFY